MFNHLIESQPKRKKSATGTIMSIVLHSLVAVAAVYATASAGLDAEKDRQENIKFVETPKAKEVEVKKEEPPPPEKIAVVPPPKGFQVLRAPVEIPIDIPKIDLSRRVTNEEDFSGKGVAGGTATGVVGGRPIDLTSNQTYFSFQVEKQVEPIGSTQQVAFPEALRSTGTGGEVGAQFVVDTLGRIETGSFKVLKATNDLFASAVRSHLPRMRFYPAEVGGRKVRQLVQQNFVFNIQN
ncbi:MAG TPA: energy transducer TonB [Gemmatimonadaceae bacterium]|nr:energy transducer TonB [Gemmatimonadaceae bacterium]